MTKYNATQNTMQKSQRDLCHITGTKPPSCATPREQNIYAERTTLKRDTQIGLAHKNIFLRPKNWKQDIYDKVIR